MRETSNFQQKEIVELLNKCWMTHDGMWFFHSLQEFGIETTNKINKSAIKSLASIEIPRVRKILNCEGEFTEFQCLKTFLEEVKKIMVPDFMNVEFAYPQNNVIEWVFKQNKCFAYKGIQMLGAIEDYECGVLYRIKCWLDELGIPHRVIPEIDKCQMHFKGSCSGEIQLFGLK